MSTAPDPTSSTTTGFWGSYAIGVLADLDPGPDIVTYLERIEATLAPHGGVFLVHGGRWDQVEGDAIGEPVVIAFPDPGGAARWYRSDAYRQIVALRTDHSVGRVFLVEGVDAAHRSSDLVKPLTRARRAGRSTP